MPDAGWTLRPAVPEDVEPLARLYASAVEVLGPTHYSQAQVASWAAFAGEGAAFRAFVLDVPTLLAELDGSIVGFGGLTPEGRIASLYVDPAHGRRGVATGLLQALVQQARAMGIGRLHTEASVFSRPVFERAGFQLDDIEVVDRRGATFQRYLMSLLLRPAP